MHPSTNRVFLCWLPGICLLATLTVSASASACERSFLGAWSFDAQRSRLVADTVEYQSLGEDRYRFVDAASPAGYTFALDGHEVVVRDDRTIAWRTLGTGHWQTTFRIAGQVTETATLTLARDGGSLHVVAAGALPNGERYRHEKDYRRVGAGNELAGTWRNVAVDTNDMADGYVLSEPRPGVYEWSIPTDRQHFSGHFDGSDLPLIGPTVPAGITFAVRERSCRQLDYVSKKAGTIEQHGTITISDDGETLTETSWRPGREDERSTGVFRRHRCDAPGGAETAISKDGDDWLCNPRTP